MISWVVFAVYVLGFVYSLRRFGFMIAYDANRSYEPKMDGADFVFGLIFGSMLALVWPVALPTLMVYERWGWRAFFDPDRRARRQMQERKEREQIQQRRQEQYELDHQLEIARRELEQLRRESDARRRELLPPDPALGGYGDPPKTTLVVKTGELPQLMTEEEADEVRRRFSEKHGGRR